MGYLNEICDYEALAEHWDKACASYPENVEYKAQYFMALTRCIKPEKAKQVALQLYKQNKETSTYLCWAVMSMLAQQAMAEPKMNDEEYFSQISRSPPQAENTLLSNIAIKALERCFEETNTIKSHSEAKLYLMANEASGNHQTVLELYNGTHKYLQPKQKTQPEN